MVPPHVVEYFRLTTMDDGDLFVTHSISLEPMKEVWHADSLVIVVWNQRETIQLIHSLGLLKFSAMVMKGD